MMRFNRRGQWNVPFCKKPERFAPAYVTKICNQINKDIFCNNLSDHISDHIDCKECIEKYFYGKVLNCHN